jgi:hypothetical protein
VLVADLPSVPRDHRGLVLSVLALVGATIWMPLFPHLDYSAAAGAAGVAFGLLAIRANPPGLCRALAILGLLGGSVGVALQLLWIVFSAVA